MNLKNKLTVTLVDKFPRGNPPKPPAPGTEEKYPLLYKKKPEHGANITDMQQWGPLYAKVEKMLLLQKAGFQFYARLQSSEGAPLQMWIRDGDALAAFHQHVDILFETLELSELRKVRHACHARFTDSASLYAFASCVRCACSSSMSRCASSLRPPSRLRSRARTSRWPTRCAAPR